MRSYVNVALWLSLLAPSATLTSAQTTETPVIAPPSLKVNAPLAQKILLDMKASHPEIKKIGLHTVPPGETESCIIANPMTSKIGKISSSADLTVITSWEPKIYPHAEEGGFFDMGLPMSDTQNRHFGLLVLEIPYRYAVTEKGALQIGLKIRDEVEARIPSKAALFEPTSSHHQ